MVDSFKLDYLGKFVTLLNSAATRRKNFPDELCNFLVYEFNLNASAILKIRDRNRLEVIGNSSYTIDDLSKKSIINSKSINKFIDSSYFILDEQCNDEIRISDSKFIESGYVIKLADLSNVLLKISKTDNNEGADAEFSKKLCDLVSLALYLWHVAPSGEENDSEEENEFSKIVKSTSEFLKEPLKIIEDNSSILSQEYLSTYQLKYVSNIKESVEKVLFAAKELNEIAEYESGSLVNSRNTINVNEYFSKIVDEFNFENPAHADLLKLNLDSSLPETVEIDNDKLKNALKTIFKIAKVLSIENNLFLSVSIKQGIFNFIITSGGKGFKQFEDKLFFSPFDSENDEIYEEANVTSKTIKILLNNLNLLNGNLKITKSDSGKSYFNLSITGESMPENITENIEEPKQTSRNKILVIEDDYATSKMLGEYLNKWDYEPVVVNSGEATLKAISEHSFMAIILDIELPDVNGLELLKTIHNHPKSKFTPVIACSIEPNEQKAYLFGAVDFFEKPINYGFLVEALAHYKLNKNSKILCVDDDVPTLSLIEKSIDSAGYIPIAESNSSRVMERINDLELDLAIIDLDMPSPNGYELIKLIKSETKFNNLPIIIFTGKDDFKEELKNVDGLFDYLLEKKSTKVEDLVLHINSVIKKFENPPPFEEVINKSDVVKILLAEDYKHSQIIVTRLLKKNNYENIVVVENGLQAYELAQKETFNIILMDMQMPIMNGFEATSKIRKLPGYSSTPIIALTAFAMKGDKEKCLDAGATDYIPKPIDSKEFIKKVNQYTKAE